MPQDPESSLGKTPEPTRPEPKSVLCMQFLITCMAAKKRSQERLLGCLGNLDCFFFLRLQKPVFSPVNRG